MSRPRRIGIFGGTFDPVHEGHIATAEAARSACGLDEVRFVPCRISPHKTSLTPAPAADRIAMLHLATAQHPWASVDPLETERDEPSFSWRTAEEMQRSFPGAELFWIMGVDQWETLPLWNRPEHLASLVGFIVVHRNSKQPKPLADFSCTDVPSNHPASASLIREKIATESNPQGWLHPEVAAYIARKGLYRANSRSSGS